MHWLKRLICKFRGHRKGLALWACEDDIAPTWWGYICQRCGGLMIQTEDGDISPKWLRDFEAVQMDTNPWATDAEWYKLERRHDPYFFARTNLTNLQGNQRNLT